MQADDGKILALRGLELFMNALGSWVNDRRNLQAVNMGFKPLAWPHMSLRRMERKPDGVSFTFGCHSQIVPKLDSMTVGEMALYKEAAEPSLLRFRISAVRTPGGNWRITLDYGDIPISTNIYSHGDFARLAAHGDSGALARQAVEAFMVGALGSVAKKASGPRRIGEARSMAPLAGYANPVSYTGSVRPIKTLGNFSGTAF